MVPCQLIFSICVCFFMVNKYTNTDKNGERHGKFHVVSELCVLLVGTSFEPSAL